MAIRIARHTAQLEPLEAFYTQVAGLERIGGFSGHEGYDGIMLGIPGADWHLEFTVSSRKPQRKIDEDDAIVFYFHSEVEKAAITKAIDAFGADKITPLNPYWKNNAVTVRDPDGHPVIFAYKEIPLTATDAATKLLAERGIKTWNELSVFIRDLPYGRNTRRSDPSLCITEMRGTCSSKHALMKMIADANNISTVKLFMGIYRMTAANSPAVAKVISASGLDYIPEAHCYLKVNGQWIDIMTRSADVQRWRPDLLKELEIKPEQVDQFKVNYHRRFVEGWILENNIPLNLAEVWKVRENCIQALGN